jgi:HEAT repeat protein
VKWATRGLVRLGPVAVPPLLEAAASDQARLRRYAIRCLGHLADPRAYETVLAALEDTDEGVCRQAVLAVPNFAARSLGTSAADVARLKQVAPRCGEEVLASLLTFGEAGRQAVMELALEEGDPHAARWLWQQGDERGRTLLLAALNGPPERRKVAIRLLAERPDDEQLVEVFIEGLSTISQWERGEIAQALVRLHHPKGLEALLDLSRSEVLQDRKGAAEALGQWDDPRSIEALVTLLNDPHRKVRPKAVAALVNLGESARPALVEAVSSHPSRGVRRLAATALRALDVRQ